MTITTLQSLIVYIHNNILILVGVEVPVIAILSSCFLLADSTAGIYQIVFSIPCASNFTIFNSNITSYGITIFVNAKFCRYIS